MMRGMRGEFNPWLIQRCELRKPKPKQITGFDSVFSCDYMGSAEFEFGELPKSLRRITASLDKYFKLETEIKDHKGTPVFVICASDELAQKAISILPKLADRSYWLKEATYLDDMLKGTKKFTQVHLWWDIDNDWFFCIGKPTAKLLMKALSALRDRWAKEQPK